MIEDKMFPSVKEALAQFDTSLSDHMNICKEEWKEPSACKSMKRCQSHRVAICRQQYPGGTERKSGINSVTAEIPMFVRKAFLSL